MARSLITPAPSSINGVKHLGSLAGSMRTATAKSGYVHPTRRSLFWGAAAACAAAFIPFASEAQTMPELPLADGIYLVGDKVSFADPAILTDTSNPLAIETLFVGAVPDVPFTMVESAVAAHSDDWGWAVMVQLNAEGAERFAGLSQDNIGGRLAVVVDGKLLSAPVVREAITGGRLHIAGGLDFGRAAEIANTLNPGSARPPPDPPS